MRFFNFSNTASQVKFGGQVSQLTKGESTVVKSDVSDQGGLLPFLRADTNNRIVFENCLFSQPGGRVLVKVLPQLNAPEPPQPAGPQPSSSP